MKSSFSFRTDRYDFWPIYNVIKTYYPLGIRKHEGGVYFEYSGIVEMEKIVVDNIHNASNFNSRFTEKSKTWEKESGYKIIGTTYGQAPSFSAYIQLNKEEIKNIIIEARLNIVISLIGPFYTLYVSDMTSYVEREAVISEGERMRNKFYRQRIHRNIISPSGEFSSVFKKIRTLVENDFKNYRFVPYFIHSQFIHGLQVRYNDTEENRVFHALFNDQFDFDALVTGEEYDYGFDQWFIDNPNMENHWMVLPPK